MVEGKAPQPPTRGVGQRIHFIERFWRLQGAKEWSEIRHKARAKWRETAKKRGFLLLPRRGGAQDGRHGPLSFLLD
jgi:hypothetical protein